MLASEDRTNAADADDLSYLLTDNRTSAIMNQIIDELGLSPDLVDCSESNYNETNFMECLNNSEPVLPPNACICELAATQFTPEYATFNLILIVATLPTVAAFGVITNALALFVYTRPHMLTSPINLYLAALAVSDIFVDLCGISSIAIDSARRFDPLLNEIHLAIIPYTLPLCYIAQMCSVYFTVLAAFDCYATVCNPRTSTKPNKNTFLVQNRRRRRRGVCSRPNAETSAKLYIILIVLACFLYNCVTFGDLHVVECVDYSRPELGERLKKEICPTDLRVDPVYSQVYKVYMYAVFMTFLPFGILLTLNCVIIWKIYRMSNEKKTQITITRCDSINSDLDKTSVVDETSSANESTFMLVMVVALFLVCNSIALVVNIIETFGNYPMEDAEAANRLFFVIDIGNFLVVFNSSANFLIYYAFSKAFRQVLTKKRRKILGRLTGSFSSLNTQYYLACSSIKINRDDLEQTPDDENQRSSTSPVEQTAHALASIAQQHTVSLTPQTPSSDPPTMDSRKFLNGKNLSSKSNKNSRGAYELLSVKRVSPTPVANDQNANNRDKKTSSISLPLPTTV